MERARDVSGFRILDHPADLGIEAWGSSLNQAFEQAALGLISVILNPQMVNAREQRSIRLEAADDHQLLVKWLTEILYLYDGDRFVATQFKIASLSGPRLEAVVGGEAFDPDRHETRLDVKAITYHQLQISQSPERSSLQVFLDI
ncbi:MAG: archease [Acidobacteriota bacterium]